MKKILISLLSGFYISFSSSMVVSCFSSMPPGSKINVNWTGTNGSTPPDSVIDNYLPTSLTLPVFNMLNSTDESRKEASHKDDGMTTLQINNSLSKFKNTLEADQDNWKNFYQEWESNKNYSYSKIEISTINNDALTTIKSYDSSTDKTTDIITTENISNTISYLNQNAINPADGHSFVYINLSKYNTNWDASTLKLTFFFDNDRFQFNVNISNLVAEASLVKIKDKYEWFLTGYNFASEKYYPSTKDVNSGNYFSFLNSEISDQQGDYIINDLNYTIDPTSILIN